MGNVLDQIGLNIKKKIEENKEENIKKISVDSKNEIISIENRHFDYSELERETACFLREQESKIKNIFSKAYTELGKVLLEAQENLAKHSGGVFEKWYESIGFKKDKVYRLISRYKLVLANCENRNLIENLPLSLSYEISKENCPEELRDKVFSGEIQTLQEFLDLKNTMKNIEKNYDFEKYNLNKKIQSFEMKYENFRKNIIDNIHKIEGQRKEKLFKEIHAFEKKIEKIIEEYNINWFAGVLLGMPTL